LSSMFQDIEDNFVNEELTYETLSAFEKRATQKVEDLADYLNIYADKNLSEEFRLRSREMTLGVFNSEINLQKYFESLDFIEDTTSKILFFSDEEGDFLTEIDSVRITDFFHKKTMLTYTGNLQFSQKILRLSLADTVVVSALNRDLEIIISKNKKQFGDSFQKVWEVTLGRIGD